jgi:hypothetical protein
LSIPVIAGGGCLGTSIYGSATPCSAGDLIDQSLHTPGVIDLGIGSATLDGTTYSDVSFSGEFTFSAPPAPLPASSANVIVLTAPFIFNGMLRGFSNGQELFSVDLTGTGTTNRGLFRIAPGLYSYQLESLTGYTFTSQEVTPTPEPGSLMLLGTGLAALAVRRRRSVKA